MADGIRQLGTALLLSSHGGGGKGAGRGAGGPVTKVDAPCRLYQAGNCTYGVNCRFRHDGSPTKVDDDDVVSSKTKARTPKGAKSKFAGKKVGLPLCGGNIDSRLLATVLLRNLAREGRLARLRIALKDQPGALHKVVSLFERHNVNIIEVYHQRVFTKLPAKGLITDIECEARNKSQVDALIADMRGAGYDVHPVELA